MKKEAKPRTFAEMMDFLAADEREAIEGYEEIISMVEDEHVVKQLEEILAEERAHLAYLERAKEDPSADYEDPHGQPQPAWEAIADPLGEAAETIDPEWMQ